MIDASARAFLQREIFESKKTVTYRLLSRKLGIHVNAAKDALSSFHAETRASGSPAYATYWLSGNILSPNTRSKKAEGSMDVDEEASQEQSIRTMRFIDSDVIEVTEPIVRKVMLVSENELESIQVTFNEIVSLHVYSLSSNPITDAHSLMSSIHEVWRLDSSKNIESVQHLGKIPCAATESFGGSGELTWRPVGTEAQAPIPKVSGAVAKEKAVKKEDSPDDKMTEIAKPKAGGKLDWSKAKVKEVKKEHTPSHTTGNTGGAKRTEPAEPAESQIKKPTQEHCNEGKQPLTLVNIGRGETPEKLIKEEKRRVKNGVIMSEDEEEESYSQNAATRPTNFRKGKSKALPTDDEAETDAERSLRAMMDMDDSEIINASKRKAPSAPPTSGEEDSDVPPTSPEDAFTTAADTSMDIDKKADGADDVDDDSDSKHKSKVKVKPRKKKEKRVIPVGRNGLPKKRVIKSKVDFDDKGYMATVDYSSYESVDEEVAEAEKEQEKADKGFKRGKAAAQGSQLKRHDSDSKKSTGAAKSRSAIAAGGQTKRQQSQTSLNGFLKKKT